MGVRLLTRTPLTPPCAVRCALCAGTQELGVPLEPISTQWLLCLYLNVLPMECVLRIWDAFFSEGSGVLLRVSHHSCAPCIG
eukprot:COSAG01_NODE_11722_length_1872_cov_1.880993_2_plen_82_part_00